MECMLQRVRKVSCFTIKINMSNRPKQMSCPPRLFVEEFCELHEKKKEKVERKRKTDRDLCDVEVVEVDTPRKQLKIHFVGLSYEYDEWRENYLR